MIFDLNMLINKLIYKNYIVVEGRKFDTGKDKII